MRIITGFVSLSLQCFEDIGFSLAVPYRPAMLVYTQVYSYSRNQFRLFPTTGHWYPPPLSANCAGILGMCAKSVCEFVFRYRLTLAV